MSRPMELAVNRRFKDRQGNDWYVWGDTCVRPWIADSYSGMKRLSEAELAAEWHKQDNHCGQKLEGYAVAHNGEGLAAEEVEVERLRTIYRFATLAHYDETQP